MRRALLLAAVLATGCSPQAIRIGVDVLDGVCAVARGLGVTARRPVAFDVYRNGTVRPVYPEGAR